MSDKESNISNSGTITIIDGFAYSGLNIILVEEDGLFIVDPNMVVGFNIQYSMDNSSCELYNIPNNNSVELTELNNKVSRIINILGNLYSSLGSDFDGKINLE